MKLTSIVLLFLVIIPKLAFPLSGHAPLGLLHLFGFIVAGLKALACIEVLKV